jgi:hypothetical protein
MVRRGLARMEKHPKDAVRLFERLAETVDRNGRRSVQDWHGAQTRYLMSLAQTQAGDAAAARRTLARIAEEHRQSLIFHMRAFVSASAASALELARAGKVRSAERVLKSADRIARSLAPGDRLFQHARRTIRVAARAATQRRSR